MYEKKYLVFCLLSLLAGTATLWSLTDCRKNELLARERIIFGMRHAEVETAIGRPPDHPLNSPGAYGFAGMEGVASSAAGWDKEDCVVFYDKKGAAICVLHGPGFEYSQPRKTISRMVLEWFGL